MNITWYGHAAFLLTTDDDKVRIGLDPYRAPDAGTYAPIDDVADFIVLSHINERYHSHIAAFQARGAKTLGAAVADVTPVVVNGLGVLQQDVPYLTVRGIPFWAVRVYEDDTKADEIAMVATSLDGVRVLHMGDCGHALDAATVRACGSADVLLALAGDGPTLDLSDLVKFVADLRPKIVIPMHFGNDKINLNLRPVDDLLALLPPTMPVRRLSSPTVRVGLDNLPQATEVWVLPPAR